MGERKRRRQEFLQANRWCCFCGGTTPSLEPDHIPPRTFFRNRHWPEGYEFPACYTCNHSTSLLEQALDMLTRFGTSAPTEEDSQEFVALLGHVQNNHPKLQQDMHMRPNEKRKAFKQLGVTKPEGMAWADVPVVQFPPYALFAVKVLGFKIGCALHYKHIGRPLPADGYVQNDLLTNATLMLKGIPKEIRELATRVPVLMRSGKDLSQQFAYRYSMNVADGEGVFSCLFRESFAMNVVTVENLARAGIGEHAGATKVEGFLANLAAHWEAFKRGKQLAA